MPNYIVDGYQNTSYDDNHITSANHDQKVIFVMSYDRNCGGKLDMDSYGFDEYDGDYYMLKKPMYSTEAWGLIPASPLVVAPFIETIDTYTTYGYSGKYQSRTKTDANLGRKFEYSSGSWDFYYIGDGKVHSSWDGYGCGLLCTESDYQTIKHLDERLPWAQRPWFWSAAYTTICRALNGCRCRAYVYGQAEGIRDAIGSVSPDYGAAPFYDGRCWVSNVKDSNGQVTITISYEFEPPERYKKVSKRRSAITNVPSQNGVLTYNGSQQEPSFDNYDRMQLAIRGDTSATNAGTYTVTFTPLSGYEWGDGSTGPKSVTWTINQQSADIPYQSEALTYNGSVVSPTWTNYDSGKMRLGGTTSAVYVGTYGAVFTLNSSNYIWSDGSTALSRTVSWMIARATVAIPTQNGTLTYNGSAQSPSWNNYSSSIMVLGGMTSGTNAGSYTATFRLIGTDSVMWADGTTSDKSVTWTIGKKTPTIVFTEPSGAVSLGDGRPTSDWYKTYTVKYTVDSPGTVSANISYRMSTVDAYLTDVTRTQCILHWQSYTGSSANIQKITITVTVAETENYKAGSKTSSTIKWAPYFDYVPDE